MISLNFLLLIILLAASSFFSSSETALTSITRIMLKRIVKERRKGAKLVNLLKNKMDSVLTIILIGNNFVNTLASATATALAISLYGEKGAGIAAAVMTIAIILFGEILPKTIAYRKPVEIACLTAPLLYVFRIIMKPFERLFSHLQKLINKTEKAIWKTSLPLITEDELKTLIDLGDSEGTLESGEKEMLHNIFEFSDLKVRDIMKHRSLIRGIPANADYEAVISAFKSSGYSRLTVHEENLDNIIGIIHFKDVLFNKAKLFNLKNIIRPVPFVPETKSVVSLLALFKKEKQNFAIVVDEHGSNHGIITMNDILKAVFGRITDEYSLIDVPAEERIKILSPNQFLIPGDLYLNEVNQIFTLQLQSEDFDTFGGWLLEQFGYLPTSGESIQKNKLIFTVEELSQRRIRSIRLSM